MVRILRKRCMQSSDTPIGNDATPSVESVPPKTETVSVSSPAARVSSPTSGTRLIIGGVLALGLLFVLKKNLDRNLAIESAPTGASVFINGRLVGKTPIRIGDLKGGTYSVRLEKEEFASVSLPVVLGLGTTHLNETLPPRGVGVVKVAVEPVGAEVILDGELVGNSPLDLNSVAAGSHELLIRKTNFKTYTQRISLEAGQTQEFKDFALEDVILTMLQSNIEKEPQRVGHYMDMGHYLFANNKIKEAGDFYVRGLQVAGQPLTFDKTIAPEERVAEEQARGHDIERINDEVRKKLNNAGRNLHEKDLRLLAERIAHQQEANAMNNAGDWKWVYEQARNFIEERKFDQAEAVYQRHIEVAKGRETVAQAYIGLITLRINYMKDVAQALAACKEFAASPFSNNAAVARQGANAIYGGASNFEGKNRSAMLAEAEALLRRALANSPRRSEMSALCKFELGNVMFLQERFEDAVPLYRDSVVETGEPTTKELRSQRQVDALRKLNRNDDAREVLKLLARSPRPDINTKATSDLRELDAIKIK